MIRAILAGLLFILLSGVGYFYFFHRPKSSSPVPVEITPVQTGKFTSGFIAYGKLFARKKEEVVSLTSGIINDRYFVPGQILERETILATVSPSEPERSKKAQDLEFALLDLQILEEQFEQSKHLLEAKAISEREHKELTIRKYKQQKYVEKLRKELAPQPVETVAGGLLAEKKFRDGDRVAAGAVLAVIVDTASFAVDISVPQQNIAEVRIGQTVQFTPTVLGAEVWGNVLELARMAHQPAQQFGPTETEPEFRVIATIEGLGANKVLLGSQVEARFLGEEVSNALFVPIESILLRINQSIVFRFSNGIAKRTNVITGLWNGRFVEIREGLSHGDTVITKGNLDVEDGTPVTLSEKVEMHDPTKPRSGVRFFTP
jgi:RND family efflux transporter MFP subunit